MDQQVPSIGERRRAKLGLGHHKGWLEGELVSQEDIEVECCERCFSVDCSGLHFKLHGKERRCVRGDVQRVLT